jgi:hypothetical protein
MTRSCRRKEPTRAADTAGATRARPAPRHPAETLSSSRVSSMRVSSMRVSSMRVLVEGPAWAVTDVERELEADGVDIVLCRGSNAPATLARGGCPLLAGHPCPLADGVDLIVCADRQAPQLVAAHRGRHPSVGIMVIPPGPELAVEGNLA